MRHHLRNPHFKEGVVECTKAYFASRPWTGTKFERTAKMQEWASNVAALYDLVQPIVIVAEEPEFSILRQSNPHMIVLPSHAVIYLFHYFRHYMQMHGDIPEDLRDVNNLELDAVDWSCSLFYQANPGQFEKSVRSGKIRYVTPDELTPIDQIDAAPLAEGDLAAFDEIADRFMEDLADDDQEFMSLMEQMGGQGNEDT